MVVDSTPNAVSAFTERSSGSLVALDYSTGLLDYDLLVVLIAPCYLLQMPQRRNVVGLSHAQLHGMVRCLNLFKPIPGPRDVNLRGSLLAGELIKFSRLPLQCNWRKPFNCRNSFKCRIDNVG